MDLFVKLRACFQNLSTIARKAKVAAVDDLLQKAISEPLETRTMLTAVSLSGDAGATSWLLRGVQGIILFLQNQGGFGWERLWETFRIATDDKPDEPTLKRGGCQNGGFWTISLFIVARFFEVRSCKFSLCSLP